MYFRPWRIGMGARGHLLCHTKILMFLKVLGKLLIIVTPYIRPPARCLFPLYRSRFRLVHLVDRHKYGVPKLTNWAMLRQLLHICHVVYNSGAAASLLPTATNRVTL